MYQKRINQKCQTTFFVLSHFWDLLRFTHFPSIFAQIFVGAKLLSTFCIAYILQCQNTISDQDSLTNKCDLEMVEIPLQQTYSRRRPENPVDPFSPHLSTPSGPNHHLLQMVARLPFSDIPSRNSSRISIFTAVLESLQQFYATLFYHFL